MNLIQAFLTARLTSITIKYIYEANCNKGRKNQEADLEQLKCNSLSMVMAKYEHKIAK